MTLYLVPEALGGQRSQSGSGERSRTQAEPAKPSEVEAQFDTPTRTHKQAAEAFWAWALTNGYLPGIIANARYPGSQEQARECC